VKHLYVAPIRCGRWERMWSTHFRFNCHDYSCYCWWDQCTRPLMSISRLLRWTYSTRWAVITMCSWNRRERRVWAAAGVCAGNLEIVDSWESGQLSAGPACDWKSS
jgi:hypothetical protein